MKSGLGFKRYVASIFALLAVSTATGALLVHDNFDYALDATIAAGGTLGFAADGFSNAWKFDGYSGEVVAGLEFTGVQSSGNALKISNDTAGYLFRGMTAPLTAGTYYMSSIFFRDDVNDGGGENWRWEVRHASSHSSGPISSIKVSLGSTSGEQVNLQVAGDSFQVGSAVYSIGTPVFMLARITVDDSGAETASMKWYNFGDTLPTVDSGIAWDATSTGAFTGGSGWKLVMNVNNTEFTVDEFRMGTELADVVPVSDQDPPPGHPSFLHVFNFLDHYEIHNGEASPKYLSVDGAGGYTNDSPVKLLDENGQPTQRWIVDPLANGNARIRSFSAPCYVRANAEEGGWNNGDPVQLHSWMNWGSQKWTVVPQDNGAVAFQMDNSGFYLSAAAFTNDAPTEVYSWQDEPRQKWMLDLQETMQSPYILRGSDGNLLAFFRYTSPIAGNKGLLYASLDDGQTWSLRTVFNQDIYGPTLFVLNNALYMLYLDVADGKKLKLKKSIDHGFSWSSHVLSVFSDNLETSGGTDVLIKDGILYYGFVDKGGPGGWPTQFRLRVASCSVSNDLTLSANWTITSPLAFPSIPAVAGTENGWLEPNCLAGPDGRVWVVVRVDKTATGDVAAVLKVSMDRTVLEFANQYPAPGNETGFIDAPWAGSSKFHIVYDDVSSRYLVMGNPYLGASSSNSRHSYVRNILALYETTDLKNYQLVKTLVEDDSLEDWSQSSWFTGFQYPAFMIDGSSLKYVCRTAYRSYDNYHDGNMGTYHELEDFRSFLTPDGEVAYYPFDEAGNPGFDFSKMRGGDADVHGAASTVDGKYGNALAFDGASAGLGTMHRLSPKLHRAGVVSLSAWIKNDTGAGTMFASAIDGADAGLEIQILGSKLRMSARSLPSDPLQAREFNYSSTGQWHHVVAQWNFDSGTMRLWLDKVEQAGAGSVAFGSQEYLRGAPAFQDAIGHRFDGTGFFDGCIDELHIYARALGEWEIKALYDGPGYGEWAGSYTLIGGAYGDEDSDGLVNLHEYGLGGDPTNAADKGFPISFSPNAGSGFDYVYPRRTAPDAGLAYRLETSTNLVSGIWTNSGYVELPDSGTINAEFDSVTNQVPVDDAGCGFIRLMIEQQ